MIYVFTFLLHLAHKLWSGSSREGGALALSIGKPPLAIGRLDD